MAVGAEDDQVDARSLQAVSDYLAAGQREQRIVPAGQHHDRDSKASVVQAAGVHGGQVGEEPQRVGVPGQRVEVGRPRVQVAPKTRSGSR